MGKRKQDLQRAVYDFLKEGYGVEDIAVMLSGPASDLRGMTAILRDMVVTMRANGVFDAMFHGGSV